VIWRTTSVPRPSSRWPTIRHGQRREVVVQAISKDIIPTFLTASRPHGAGCRRLAHDVVGNLVANSAIDPSRPRTPRHSTARVQGMTFDGQLYGVPYSVENIALFRNTDWSTAARHDGRPRRRGKRLVGKDGVPTHGLQVGQPVTPITSIRCSRRAAGLLRPTPRVTPIRRT
jgi:hypothetical protein